MEHFFIPCSSSTIFYYCQAEFGALEESSEDASISVIEKVLDKMPKISEASTSVLLSAQGHKVTSTPLKMDGEVSLLNKATLEIR